ncbi:HEPN domain-containing protein [uncultured Pseudoxanthomonas sp.]|uniref:HEPN domain-containing protein n=1 Tax=uncultured Pseudoxanthomonas sp. TaxID=281701 RepID=UPI002603B6DD|nr:HEPN domain-containing protein [uncultured Pseudoxanthomonas sp.]
MVPAIVCLAFSVELAFKALIVADGREPGQIHDLRDLFGKLPSVLQDEIVQWCIGKEPEGGFKMSDDKLVVSVQSPRDNFEFALSRASGAFHQWRYVFEPKNANAQFDNRFMSRLGQVCQTILAREIVA